MKIKWHYSLILSILALIGASQIDFEVPNQELTVDFFSKTVSDIETENAITTIVTRLENAGASNIKIQQQYNRLRIRYFSPIDVSSIRTVFFDGAIASVFTNIKSDAPNDKDSFPKDVTDGYQLNISELHKGTDVIKDVNGHLVNIDSTTIRFFNPFVYFSYTSVALEHNHHIFTTAFKINQQVALARPSVDYVIPEVRAGPLG